MRVLVPFSVRLLRTGLPVGAEAAEDEDGGGAASCYAGGACGEETVPDRQEREPG